MFDDIDLRNLYTCDYHVAANHVVMLLHTVLGMDVIGQIHKIVPLNLVE